MTIRIRVITILLMSILVYPMYAQKLRRDQEQEIAVGLTGGMSFSRVSFLHNNTYRANELGNQGFWPGYRFGTVFRYTNQTHFGVKLEVCYTQAGWKEKFEETSGVAMVNKQNMQNVQLSRRLEYIEIPALAHIYFGKRKVRFFVELGPKICVNTKYADLEWNIPEDDDRRSAILSDDPRLCDDHSKIDYGLCGGLGMDFLIGQCHAIVSGRYSYDFKDVYGNGKADVFQRSNNQLINASLTFLWSITKYTEKSRKLKKYNK